VGLNDEKGYSRWFTILPLGEAGVAVAPLAPGASIYSHYRSSTSMYAELGIASVVYKYKSLI
jgi:hypothetical protein